MREIVHLQAGQCGNQIGSKVRENYSKISVFMSKSENTSGRLILSYNILPVEIILIVVSLNTIRWSNVGLMGRMVQNKNNETGSTSRVCERRGGRRWLRFWWLTLLVVCTAGHASPCRMAWRHTYVHTYRHTGETRLDRSLGPREYHLPPKHSLFTSCYLF